MNYVSYLRAHARLLAFGFLLTFFSSFGQTFFISLFGGELRATFELTHGSFGLVYSVATLVSGFCLIWVGRMIDHVPLRTFALAVCLGFAGACVLLSAVPNVLLLGVALFALRFTGQGLLSHTGMTTVSRYIEEGRGTALSIAGAGWPAGEALFPWVGVMALGHFGWRATWIGCAIVVVVTLLPTVLGLLRRHEERHRAFVERVATTAGTASAHRRQWTRVEVVRDPTFYLVLSALIAPPFVLTGLFFHQIHLVTEKAWDLGWFASCFVGFAISHFVGSLGAGPLVDRFGAHRVAQGFLAPLALGLTALAGFDAPIAAAFYLGLAGLSAGAGGAVGGALWADLYGVTHLGAIRALTSSVMVFSTALSPVSMGALIDRHVRIETIAWACVAYLVVASSLVLLSHRRVRTGP
jgi:MFS family permease